MRKITHVAAEITPTAPLSAAVTSGGDPVSDSDRPQGTQANIIRAMATTYGLRDARDRTIVVAK